jgi:hypothetical protein
MKAWLKLARLLMSQGALQEHDTPRRLRASHAGEWHNALGGAPLPNRFRTILSGARHQDILAGQVA